MTYQRPVLAVLVLAIAACGAEIADDGTATGRAGPGSSSGSGPTSEKLGESSSSSSSGSSGYYASADGGYYGGYAGYDASVAHEPPPSSGADGSVSDPPPGTTPPGSFRSDAAAPLPPAQDGGGFNAIYSASEKALFLPMFSTPTCVVVPPYGEVYVADLAPRSLPPSGVYPSCFGDLTTGCYTPSRSNGEGERNEEMISGGRFELSAFDANGIATGGMDTAEGFIALAVKYCP